MQMHTQLGPFPVFPYWRLFVPLEAAPTPFHNSRISLPTDTLLEETFPALLFFPPLGEGGRARFGGAFRGDRQCALHLSWDLNAV